MQQATLTSWRWRIFTSTWLAYAGLYFCRKTFFVVKADLGDELLFDAMWLGYIEMVYHIAYVAGQLISARLGPVIGPRVLLLTGIAASVGANVVFGFANDTVTFGVFMAVNGLAQATGWPSTIGTLAYWTKREERGTVVGIWSTCFQLGGILASSWAAFWLASQGWRGAFFAGSAVLLAVWVYVWFFQANRPEDVGLPPIADEDIPTVDEDTGRPVKHVFPKGVLTSVLLVGAFYFCIKFIRYAIWSWAPYLMTRNFGLSTAQSGFWANALFDGFGFLGVIFAGILSDKLFHARRAKLAFYMLLGMSGGCALLYLSANAHVVVFALCLALVGFMLFGPDSLMSGAGAIDVGSHRTALAAAGMINGIGAFGQVVQSVLVPYIYTDNSGQVGPVLALLFGASIAALFFLGVVLWRNRRGLSDL